MDLFITSRDAEKIIIMLIVIIITIIIKLIIIMLIKSKSNSSPKRLNDNEYQTILHEGYTIKHCI